MPRTLWPVQVQMNYNAAQCYLLIFHTKVYWAYNPWKSPSSQRLPHPSAGTPQSAMRLLHISTPQTNASKKFILLFSMPSGNKSQRTNAGEIPFGHLAVPRNDGRKWQHELHIPPYSKQPGKKMSSRLPPAALIYLPGCFEYGSLWDHVPIWFTLPSGSHRSTCWSGFSWAR